LLAALIVVLLSVGAAGAAKLITGKDIANHSITGKDIRKGSLPLSVLKGTLPAGPQGPKGETGIVGAKGSTGPAGASAITEVIALGGPIAASIAPSSTLEFVGEPAEVTVFAGDQGLIEGTVTLGTTEATIDETSKFAVSICVGNESEVLPLDKEKGGDFGVSPVIAENGRVTVTVSSGFFVEGKAGESFGALLGPCVLNETTSALDNNDRALGYVMVSSIG
jgi:hypothetical protein